MSKLLKISNDSFLQQLGVERDFIPKAFQSSLIGGGRFQELRTPEVSRRGAKAAELGRRWILSL